MRYLLDSNAWIGHFRQTSPEVTRHLRLYSSSDIMLCSVVLGELLFGVERSAAPYKAANLTLVDAMRQQFISLPFDDAAAEHYGRIRADLTAQGQIIGGNDLMIAAIALAHGCTLVTHNTAEFGRVAGLALEDWHTP